MMSFFKLSELSEDTLIGRDIGQKTREKIKDLLTEHKSLTIDMENKSSLSPSFVDEAIVMLVIEYGKEGFGERIKLVNLNRGVRGLMNSMLHDRLREKRAS